MTKKKILKHENNCDSDSTYLRCFFDISNICFDSKGPVNVKSAFVQLKQEHDQDEESVKHEEEEDGLVAQLDQISRNSSLMNT